MRKQRVILWKVVLGVLLIYLEAKDLLVPSHVPDFLQPSNLTQTIAMRFTQILIIGAGIWLLFSGITGKRTKEIATSSAKENERPRTDDAMDSN